MPILVLVGAIAAGVTGCHQVDVARGESGSASPGAGELRFSGRSPGAFGASWGRAPVGKPVAFFVTTFCTQGGPATIASVKLKDAENLEVVDWGSRRYPPPVPDRGLWNGTVLGDTSFDDGPITEECSPTERAEIDVSFSRPASAVGVTHGFYMVTTTGQLFVPMRVALCMGACPDDVENSPLP